MFYICNTIIFKTAVGPTGKAGANVLCHVVWVKGVVKEVVTTLNRPCLVSFAKGLQSKRRYANSFNVEVPADEIRLYNNYAGLSLRSNYTNFRNSILNCRKTTH